MICLQINPRIILNTFSKIEDAEPNSLSFLANSKYESYIYNTKASVVLVNNDFVPKQSLPNNLTLIKVENAYESLAVLLNYYNNIEGPPEGIESPVFLHESAQIGKNVYIGAFSYIAKGAVIGNHVQVHPNCHVGKSTVIGSNSILYPGVKIYDNCKVGNNCMIHSGAVIGSDGFGFAPNKDNEYKKISQITIDPDKLNVNADKFENLVGDNAKFNAEKIVNIFKGEDNDFSKAVCLNAAAGLIVNETHQNFTDAYIDARKHILSNKVVKHLEKIQNG